jgi:hypothetical protein
MLKLNSDDVFRMGIMCGHLETISRYFTPAFVESILDFTQLFLSGCGDKSFDNFGDLFEHYYITPKYSELTKSEIDFLGRLDEGLYRINEELSEEDIIINAKHNFCTFKIGSLLQFMKDNGVEINNIYNSPNIEYYKVYNEFKTYIELTRNIIHKKKEIEND